MLSSVTLPAQTPAKPAAPQSIDPAKIAFRSEQLTLQLNSILNAKVPEETLSETERELRKQYASIQSKAKQTRKILAGDATSLDLRELANEWRGLSWTQSSMRETLTDWNRAALANINALDSEEATWKTTLDGIAADVGSTSLRQVAERALADIRSARQQVQRQIDRIVLVQEQAVQSSLLIAQVNDDIARAEKTFHSRLLTRVAEPIWSRNQSAASESAVVLMRRSFLRSSEMLVEFAQLRKVTVAVSVISFLLVLLFLYRVRNGFFLESAGTEQQPGSPSVLIEHPLAAALILQLPFVLALTRNAPPGVLAILLLASLIPIIRVLTHGAPERRRALYLLAAFYAVGALLDVVPIDSPLRRILFLIFVALAIALLAWMLKRRGTYHWNFLGRFRPLARIAIAIGLAAMVAALCASVWGYIALAQFLRQALLLISYLSLLLIAWARVTAVLILSLVRSRFIKSPSLRSPGFGKWIVRFLNAGALAIWFFESINLLLLRAPFTQFLTQTLALHLPGRFSEISLGDLLNGLLVLLLGMLLARGFRFFLREDVLSHCRLDRGLPELISNLAYYLTILLVFLGSLKALGLDLSKLTLLTGAFGVGLGFGMQNIVNNFVSGLILEFERPIHTGDVIETAGQLGEVVRIGIRSTTIRTSQAAEVIVPNASLISGNVINWTTSADLPDSKYRIAVPVLVRPGPDPEKVSRILVETAQAQPRVLQQPEPTAYLKSSNPSSLLFEISFSIRPDASPDYVRNQVAIAASRAIRQEETAAHAASRV